MSAHSLVYRTLVFRGFFNAIGQRDRNRMHEYCQQFTQFRLRFRARLLSITSTRCRPAKLVMGWNTPLRTDISKSGARLEKWAW